MFDTPIEDRVGHTFDVELPDESEDWSVGVIVGPSGSGKTSVARQAYGPRLYESGNNWPRDLAVVEAFEPKSLSVRDITATLTAVGFSSPPDWVKPYGALSNGQRFRVDLARALLSAGSPLVAFDEFTSVVDRTVAKIGSAAVSKQVRAGRLPIKKFVAVTCHYDVVEWLEPDWVLDMATNLLARGSLPQRPDIRLEVRACHHSAWELFKKYHYLDQRLHKSSRCYVALWNGEPVAFCGMLYTMGYAGYWRVARIVTLPDYQGVGIGTRLMEWCCQYHLDALHAKRVTIVASHPAVIAHCRRSPLWNNGDLKTSGNQKHGKTPDHKRAAVVSAGRAIATFIYTGTPAKPPISPPSPEVV
jgi:GNAT superfamily N-acetyltransferase